MSKTQKYTIRPVFVMTARSESEATRHLAALLMCGAVAHVLTVDERVVGFDVPLPEGGTAGTWRAR